MTSRSSSSLSSSWSSLGWRRRIIWAPCVLLMLVLVVGVGFTTFFGKDSPIAPTVFSSTTTRVRTVGNRVKGHQKLQQQPIVDTRYMVPKELIDQGVYDPDRDFENERGIRPTYWEKNNSVSWGPCYPPKGAIIGHWHNASSERDGLVYKQNQLPQTKTKTSSRTKSASPEKGGGCRPGFLIIGAGKCGTSSLYHYLTGHPRVLPASEKQIHYFKYHLSRHLGWYYSFFPTTQSFLEHGGLMTGEASPGYLPYPSVVQAVQRLMSPTLPKIIAIGRDPIDRMYSSYKYNYVQPTTKYLQQGKRSDIQSNQPDEYYTQYLFSIEDFVRAELKQLKACLYDFGSSLTYKNWGSTNSFKPFVMERYLANGTNATIPPPLIDIEGVCYGKQVSKTVLRPQWTEMQTNNPKKVIFNIDLHLKQAMIGRSLYTFPLEWWYLIYAPEEVYFVCTEELSDPDILNDLALHLGLPSFNFSNVVAEGAYNVAGHKGYDTATSWEELELEGQLKPPDKLEITHSSGIAGLNSSSQLAAAPNPSPASEGTADDEQYAETKGIPLSEDLYQELKDFIEPINERLFALIGKRCNW